MLVSENENRSEDRTHFLKSRKRRKFTFVCNIAMILKEKWVKSNKCEKF